MTSTVAFCFEAGGESSIASICLWGFALEEELAPQGKQNVSSQHTPHVVDGSSDPRWETVILLEKVILDGRQVVLELEKGSK